MRILRASSIVRSIMALAMAFALLATPAFATVTNPQIEAKKAEAAKATARLGALRDDFEVKVEDYNRINEALQKTRAQVAVTQDRLDQEDASLGRAQQLLDDRAAGIYRGGGVDVLEVVLGTTSFEDFLTRLDLLTRIGVSDASLVSGVKDARAHVAQTKSALEQREAEQVALRGQAETKRQQVEDATAKQKDFVASLNAAVAKLIKQEEIRRAAAAKLAAEKLAAEIAAQQGSGGGGSGGRAASAAPGQGHPEIIGIAMKYIGVPYVYGGTSPSGFDCSGLAQYCYAQDGIPIPRTAQEQYYAGQHIAANRRDLLKPGDLLFFGTGQNPDAVHHVVIFAGGDNIIEAPYTGANVQVSSWAERYSHGEYVGASRF